MPLDPTGRLPDTPHASAVAAACSGKWVRKGTNTFETYLAIGDRIAGYEELRIDVVQIPLETLAAQIVATARD